MKEFNELIQIIEHLLGSDGCPWDREQTLQSMRSSLVEETFETIEAIDLDNNIQIEEELGDLFFNVVFLCKLAEKDKRFTLTDVLKHINAKLIRRHPHIFGGENLKTSEEVLKQWEAIKQKEKKERVSSSSLDGIPKDLPILSRAQKVFKKLRAKKYHAGKKETRLSPEEKAGENLLKIVQQLSEEGIHAEHALRKQLSKLESEFKTWEQQKTS